MRTPLSSAAHSVNNNINNIIIIIIIIIIINNTNFSQSRQHGIGRVQVQRRASQLRGPSV
jgi:hypothetical protein